MAFMHADAVKVKTRALGNDRTLGSFPWREVLVWLGECRTDHLRGPCAGIFHVTGILSTVIQITLTMSYIAIQELLNLSDRPYHFG